MTAPLAITRRRFLSILAAVPLLRLPELGDAPRLEPMPIGVGLPKTFAAWSALVQRRPELKAKRPAWVGFDATIWRRLRDDLAEGPRLDYLERAGWIWPPVPLGAGMTGNCVTRSLAVREFLAARGWPIGAMRPTLCWRGSEGHMGLCITTAAGDLFVDSIGNIVAPWRAFPYRWDARYASGTTWERLAPDWSPS